MTEPASGPSMPARHHTVRWLGDDWVRIIVAAARLTEQTHIEITATDVIRSATLHRVDEILKNGRPAA